MFSNMSSTAAMNDSSSSSVPAYILRVANDSDSSLGYVPFVLGTIALIGIALCYFRRRSLPNLFGSQRNPRNSALVNESTPFSLGYHSKPLTELPRTSQPISAEQDSPTFKASKPASSWSFNTLIGRPAEDYDAIPSDNDGEAIELGIFNQGDDGSDDKFGFLNSFSLSPKPGSRR